MHKHSTTPPSRTRVTSIVQPSAEPDARFWRVHCEGSLAVPNNGLAVSLCREHRYTGNWCLEHTSPLLVAFLIIVSQIVCGRSAPCHQFRFHESLLITGPCTSPLAIGSDITLLRTDLCISACQEDGSQFIYVPLSSDLCALVPQGPPQSGTACVTRDRRLL